MNDIIEKIRGRLVVSVQALPGNPLRDTYCIAHLAAAAAAGGAAAIRANGVEDLTAIRQLISFFMDRKPPLDISSIQVYHLFGDESIVSSKMRQWREVCIIT